MEKSDYELIFDYTKREYPLIFDLFGEEGVRTIATIETDMTKKLKTGLAAGIFAVLASDRNLPRERTLLIQSLTEKFSIMPASGHISVLPPHIEKLDDHELRKLIQMKAPIDVHLVYAILKNRKSIKNNGGGKCPFTGKIRGLITDILRGKNI